LNEIQIKFLFSCWINPDFFTRETLKKHYIAKCLIQLMFLFFAFSNALMYNY